MSKIIELGEQGRKKLIEGIDILADSVVCTLGPNGRNVVISSPHEAVRSTKDGVTVAKNITLKDPIQETGVQLIKQAALKTAENAGDGTTTSTLLAQVMIHLGLTHLNYGENAVKIKRDIDKAVREVIENLREISEDISSEEQLEQVATISSNNDLEIGKLIATAISKVGRDGVVHIEESKSGDTYLETVEGMQFDRGYKSHFFVTDNNTMSCTLKDPYILIADHRFNQVKDLLPILENISSTNKSLLIIAEDIDGEALATLIVNKARGTIKVCAVKAPDFGDRRKLILEDIAVLTGGKVFDVNKGMKLDKFSWDWFGQARTVTITKEKTTIVDGKGNEEEINNRITELQLQIDNAKSPFEREQLQNRLAKMSDGVSIIHVGGYNETEMNEKKDRVDDALNATQAALAEGIVPGGGCALLYARENINVNNIGAQIVYTACSSPFENILVNAGYTSTEANLNGLKLVDVDSPNTWKGFEINTQSIINMKEKGIIDPLKVTRVALENAAAVAGTILLTECVIAEEIKEEKSELMPNMF